MVHQVVTGDAALYQSFDQEHVLVLYVDRWAVVDLPAGNAADKEFLNARFYELADNWHIEVTHQIGHEHKAVFQYGNGTTSPAPVVVGNLPGKLANALLDLLRAEKNTFFCGDDSTQAMTSLILRAPQPKPGCYALAKCSRGTALTFCSPLILKARQRGCALAL